ncbi:hypothetical protein BGW41_002162 [Actinomortierella wolfii]|nr:hypothetical protein BGW41_002162 [Actinomortierella wolfii]
MVLNPIFKALEDEDIMDKRRKRPGRLVIRMWTRSQEATEFCPLLEWRMELCCLRYIGQELRDIPGSFPDNTIILGLEDGFYTAPDDDDMPEHPHLAPPPIFDPLDRLQYSVKRSYNYESVMRLNNLHECIADTEESRDEIKQNIEASLKSANTQLLLLLNSQGLQFLDLRQTLPNIRYLLETLLASSPVSKSKARQRQEDTLYHRHSLEESNAAETDDELGAPSLRVQSPDNSMGKPRIDFADSRTPSSTTDASLSAKSSRSQSSSQLERQMDAADDEDYELVNEIAQLSSNRQGRSWQVPQLPVRFFSEITDDASRSRAFRLHRASTDFSALKSYRRLDDDEDYVPVLSRRRHTTWSSHDARLVAYYSNLFVDQQEERIMQGLPILNDSEKSGRSEGRGQTSDSSESTAHEVGQAQHNSLSSLTPAPSTKVIDDEIATSLYATRSTSTRV